MSVNLIRNARVFLTTNVNSGTKKIATTGFTAANTFEIQVLDGLSFSQNTAAETVTISEAGTAPQRGQRSFNTTLEPVDWSFSTYLRPNWYEGTADSTLDLTNGDRVTAEEDCLWKVFASHDSTTFATGTTPFNAQTGAGTAWNEITSDGTITPYAWWNLKNSDKNQLIAFGLIITFDNVSFLIHNCAIESVSVDFGIDAISTAAWSGKGALLERMDTTITFGTDTTAATSSTPYGQAKFATGFTGNENIFRKKYTGSRYIANKLSQLSLASIADVFDQGTAVTYTIPITGGNITIANNLTYLTPATVGVVNQPFTYFTGTRTVTGNVTAYLRTGAANTAGLLSNFASQMVKDDENAFSLSLGLGGSTSSAVENKVVFGCPRAMLQVPSVSTDQVVSTTINFMPQSYDSTAGTYSLNSANEVTVAYYSGPAI
jgi:hypothetical protein